MAERNFMLSPFRVVTQPTCRKPTEPGNLAGRFRPHHQRMVIDCWGRADGNINLTLLLNSPSDEKATYAVRLYVDVDSLTVHGQRR